MPSSNNVNTRGVFPVRNALIPPEGPVALQAVLDFTGGVTTALVDLTQQTVSPPVQLSFVQTLFIDNSQSAVELITNIVGAGGAGGASGQRIVTPAGSQQYVPVMAQNPPVFLFQGANNASPGVQIPVYFINVPMPAMTWAGAAASGFTFNGQNLLVQDTAAETSLATLATLATQQLAPPPPTNAISGAASTTGGAATPIIAALGAGVKMAIGSIQAWNTSADTVTISLNDTAGTVLIVPAGSGTNPIFDPPIEVAANTALTFTPSAAKTTIGANAQGWSYT